MGELVDGGVDVDDKISCHHASIEKAQAELRQEYYVREERRRELEFLEKGGNPLDFKFGATTCINVQTTALTDQFLDCDAKGSSGLATSPYGDSVDSCGRPGPTLGREPNMSDNLLLIDGQSSNHEGTRNDNRLLIDGQNSNHEGTRNEIHSGKRKIAASSEHSSQQEGSNMKESEEFGVFHLGVKRQAYAGGNRSRPSRDSAFVGSARLAPSACGNSSSVFPSSCFSSRDKRRPLLETEVEDHAVSSVSNSTAASPFNNNIFRALDTDDPVEMDSDAFEALETSGLVIIANNRSGETEVSTSNHLQQNDGNDQTTKASDQQCPNDTMSLPSELIGRDAVSVGAADEAFETGEDIDSATEAGPICLSRKLVVDEKQISRHPDGQTVTGGLPSNVLQIDPSNADARADAHGAEERKPECDATIVQDTLVSEKSYLKAVDVHSVGDDEPKSADHEIVNSFVQVKDELCNGKAYLLCKGRHGLASEVESKFKSLLCDASNSKAKFLYPPSGLQVNICEPSNTDLYERSYSKSLKLSKTAHEDAILKEARKIEAKLKRVNELSLCSFPSEKHCNCNSHWDYVIEEMTWLANDFMQERLWKITAASKISHLIASGHWKFQKENLCPKHIEEARSMAKAVMSFWQVAEVIQSGGKPSGDLEKEYNISLFASWKSKGGTAAKMQDGENLEETSSSRAYQIPILGYAVGFLKYSCPCDHPVLDEAPATPERVYDAGVWGKPLEEQFSEGSLFYLVPAHAMHIYKESIETHWLQHETTSNIMHHEDYWASTCDSLADCGQENAFEEDAAEFAMHYLSGAFESNKSKYAHKRKKTLQEKSYSARPYELWSDLSYGPRIEIKLGTQRSSFTRKRPSSTFNVHPIPTKRMRTASRQRVVRPFRAGNARGIQASGKTDVSRGDTSSFKDDQNLLQCVSRAGRNTEVESTADFEQTMLFDGTDISNRSKKKKKSKHMGYKILNSTDGILVSKVAAAQFGSVGSWSQFEDQALVVLVHDMGPNWELVSDAINSKLQFKCVFRKPNECKERHKVLMHRNAGDGFDSAEDSGSSQSYFSTLAGIPKGGARQLFQCRQGPREEDTLKAHFEKIIMIGQQLYFHSNQEESKGTKQLTPVHPSHLQALSQMCPSNLMGSPLTPLDLCEITLSPEVLGLGYQGSHSNDLPMSTHTGTLLPGMPTSGASLMLRGSPVLGMSSGLSSPAPPITSTRDSPRNDVPRPPCPIDEQQRMQQQYCQMLSNRNMQQPTMSLAGALPTGTDRNVCMLSAVNGMGMMREVNDTPMARPGFQGIGSPSVSNVRASRSTLQTCEVGMPSPVNIHSRTIAGQGNSLLRPHDHLWMQRPPGQPQNPDDQKHLIMPELRHQVPQGNCQLVAPVNGITRLPSQGAPPSPIQKFSPQQHQQPHQMSQQPHLFGNPHHPQIQGTNNMSPQQQAYAMHLAKERKQVQRQFLHQQQQFAGSSAVVRSQNSSQMPQQSQPSPVTSIPSSQAQRKQQNTTRNSLSNGGMSNQMMNQRPQQQIQQQQPRKQLQQLQLQQHGSFSEGLGGGDMLMEQNVPLDASHVNTPSIICDNQVSERHSLQQDQGLFSVGPGSGSALPQSSNPQKMHSRPPPRSSKSVPPMPSHSASQQQQRQTSRSQQAMQRMMLQQNHHLNSDGPIQSAVNQVQAHQMMGTTPAPLCTGPGNAVSVATSTPLSAFHWELEPSNGTTMPAPTVQLTTSPQQNLIGTEANIVPSSQGLNKRSFSLSMHVHGIVGQWQQPKRPQQQPPQDLRHQHQLPQCQQQHQHPVQSASYMAPSNSGPG